MGRGTKKNITRYDWLMGRNERIRYLELEKNDMHHEQGTLLDTATLGSVLGEYYSSVMDIDALLCLLACWPACARLHLLHMLRCRLLGPGDFGFHVRRYIYPNRHIVAPSPAMPAGTRVMTKERLERKVSAASHCM